MTLLQMLAPQAALCLPVHCTQTPAAPDTSHTPSTVLSLVTWPQWLPAASFTQGWHRWSKQREAPGVGQSVSRTHWVQVFVLASHREPFGWLVQFESLKHSTHCASLPSLQMGLPVTAVQSAFSWQEEQRPVC